MLPFKSSGVSAYLFVAFDGWTRRACGRCLPLKVAGFYRFISVVAFDGLARRVCGRYFPLKGVVFRLNSFVALMGGIAEFAADASL